MKTPLNPSKKATKRVKNPLSIPKECNCCGKESVVLKSNTYIYGKPFGNWPWVYICEGCGSYVGIHPFTNIPLGTLADTATREARKVCKAPFEALHNTGKMNRNDAYSALADKLSIPLRECHFGWFDADMCKRAAKAAKEIYLGV